MQDGDEFTHTRHARRIAATQIMDRANRTVIQAGRRKTMTSDERTDKFSRIQPNSAESVESAAVIRVTDRW